MSEAARYPASRRFAPPTHSRSISHPGITLGFDRELAPAGSSATGAALSDRATSRVGNRFCILPMEGLGRHARRRADAI